ncbi:MAG: NUDIX domain-containing protein [Cyanobacteria bacterium P01_G01_bin.54]
MKNSTNINDWIEYCDSAWDSAGRPHGLKPSLIFSNPIDYDKYYYQYFEHRYIDLWLAIHSRVNPVNGFFFKRENIVFRKLWERKFSWKTIWKQTLPFLVYGTTLGVTHEILIELASLYCLGQAIPSMVIDQLLDNKAVEASKPDVVFCVLAYIKALRGLRHMKLPCENAIEDTFLDLTCEMYDRMLTEHDGRSNKKIPQFLLDSICEYLSPNSRLRSSIFFGILPIWAHALADRDLSERFIESTIALRTVRQLNDEILDVHEDICNGLLTLPWLYALEEKPELRGKIEMLWQDTANLDVINDCKEILKNSSGQYRAASKSMEILSESMRTTMEYFNVGSAFEITLLHNIRLALVNWLEQVNYERDQKNVREPCLPQDIILDSTNPIEPVPGGGVLVLNEENEVLMTLNLKRGMLRWELPAGVAKGEESLEETARRETKEETGKDIEIGEAVAVCWHYSRQLNKGWMGMFFRGELIDGTSANNFLVVSTDAFSHGKSHIKYGVEQYDQVDLNSYDFDELKRLCEEQVPAAHENIVASGFVNWKQIPIERMHPLHRKLLEAYCRRSQCMEILVADADQDSVIYDVDSKLYYKS